MACDTLPSSAGSIQKQRDIPLKKTGVCADFKPFPIHSLGSNPSYIVLGLGFGAGGGALIALITCHDLFLSVKRERPRGSKTHL